jgi:hypothetical protein
MFTERPHQSRKSLMAAFREKVYTIRKVCRCCHSFFWSKVWSTVLYCWDRSLSIQSQNNHVKNVYNLSKTVWNPNSCMNTICEVQWAAWADMNLGWLSNSVPFSHNWCMVRIPPHSPFWPCSAYLNWAWSNNLLVHWTAVAWACDSGSVLTHHHQLQLLPSLNYTYEK